MTVAILRFDRPNQCLYCPTIIPNDRDLCYFHARPPAPKLLPESRLDHLATHLREQDRPFLPLLIESLTFDEIAERLGPGWTTRQVALAWSAIRLHLGLNVGAPGGGPKTTLERLTILRIVANLDRCICGR